MQPFRYSTPAEQTSPLVSSDPTPAASSLQAVAEGAAETSFFQAVAVGVCAYGLKRKP